MAKRFTETEIWEDDWFFEMSPEYKLFWFYIKDNCDHAGVWTPKVRVFKAATDIDIDLQKALIFFNTGKQRIRLLDSKHWLVEDFFLFQYVKAAKNLNIRNRVHMSVLKTYIKEKISVSSINGIETVTDINNNIHSAAEFDEALLSPSGGAELMDEEWGKD